MRRTLRLMGVATAMALLVDPTAALARASAPPTACKVSPLPEGTGWDDSIVTAADPTGRFVAGRGYPSGSGDFTRYPALWDNGELHPVQMPGEDQSLNGVNSSGVAVGDSYDPGTGEPLTPWVYRNGSLQPLPGVKSGTAVAINERGDVAGNIKTIPIRWKAPATSGPEKLTLPSDAIAGKTVAIDEDGSVAGEIQVADNTKHAVVWTPAGVVRFPEPAGVSQSRTTTIRNGWVGVWTWTGSASAWVRWNLATGDITPFPQHALIEEVNSAGWLVGALDPGYRAVLTTEAGNVALRGPTGTAADTYAKSISDDGSAVAGYSADKNGDLHAVRWACG